MSGHRDESSSAYPETEVQDVAEARFGVVVRDPYRWLEADIRSDSKVRAWVDAQGKTTDDYISQLPHRQAIARRLREILNLELYWAPRKKGGRYFFQHNSGGQNQSALMVQDGLGGTPRVLLDPNSWTSDGATALSEWEPSPDGRHLAYAIQEAGSDWRTIRVLDVETGKIRDDELHWVRFTSPVWSKDGSGFFYARYPEPTRGAEHQSRNFDHRLCFHALGTDQSTDRLVFCIPEEPQLLHLFKATDDGRFLVISSVRNAEPNARVTSIDLDEPGWKPRTLVSNWDNAYTLAGNQGDTLYLVTDRNAPKGAVVTMSATASSSPVTLIPEGPHTLASAAILGGKLVVSYIVDAKSELQIFDLSGCLVSRLALPGVGSITALEGKQNDGEAFYSFESFVQPSTVYRLDLEAGTSSVFKQPTTSFDRSIFTVRQLFYRSKDGTRVPMFVAHRKDLDLSMPRSALLYGYGGYNISILPTFRGAWVQWMEMGGICALANLRGGGEYGKSWHDAGRLLNKQNVFDDFIAGAEYLIAEKLTTPEQLAIQGASNGGLLVGAVVNQRPELFAAALAQVGVMDMLRFDQFTVGRYWTSDFGNPAEEKHFRNLLSYSPYHNIKSGRAYPAILATTADTDDRVVPSHSFKYAAALQAAQIGPRPHLLRIDTRAGHGLGKPLGKAIDEASDLWAFAGYFTGLTVAEALPAPPAKAWSQ